MCLAGVPLPLFCHALPEILHLAFATWLLIYRCTTNHHSVINFGNASFHILSMEDTQLFGHKNGRNQWATARVLWNL